MKKLLLGLGAATSVIAPIAAVVACGETPEIHVTKIYVGADGAPLANIVKEQTGIEFDTTGNTHIVTKYSATKPNEVTAVISGKLSIDIPSAIVAGGIAAGTEDVKIIVVTDTTTHTSVITVNGKALIAANGKTLSAIGVALYGAVLGNEGEIIPAVPGATSRIISTSSAVDSTGTNIVAYMNGQFVRNTATVAEKKIFEDKILTTIKTATTIVKTMTISYTNAMAEPATHKALSGTNGSTALNTAVETYTSLASANKAAGLTAITLAIHTALELLFA